MRTETIQKFYAKFHELNEEQRKKVIENNSSINTDHPWHDSTISDFQLILSMLGFSFIKINFSGFAHQGDGASFTGIFKVPKNLVETQNRIKKVLEHAPEIRLDNFLSIKFSESDIEDETIEIHRTSNFYYHENTVDSFHPGLNSFVRSFSKHIYNTLSREYDDLTSEKQIEETLKLNDYEFDIDTLKIVS